MAVIVFVALFSLVMFSTSASGKGDRAAAGHLPTVVQSTQAGHMQAEADAPPMKTSPLATNTKGGAVLARGTGTDAAVGNGTVDQGDAAITAGGNATVYAAAAATAWEGWSQFLAIEFTR